MISLSESATRSPPEIDGFDRQYIAGSWRHGRAGHVAPRRGCCRRARGRDGAHELAGGAAEGLVLPPHVFGEVRPDQRLARDELFGPIAPLIRARGDEDALRIANDTTYGLSSCVLTRDLERGLRFARRVQAGMTHINDQPVNDLPFSPFGGEKNSGPRPLQRPLGGRRLHHRALGDRAAPAARLSHRCPRHRRGLGRRVVS
jgi:delta 1-pyrroline-5-carboxylate dehydrogenase